MSFLTWRPIYLATVSTAALLVLAYSTGRRVASGALPTSTSDGSACAFNQGVTSQGGRYNANVDLTASVGLPGNNGVDVVMTGSGAIAAVNTEGGGASLYWVDPGTGKISKRVTLPQAVSDLAFDGRGVLAIASVNKVLRLDAASGEKLSEIALQGVKRVAIAADGHMGAIADRTVYLYNPSNARVFSRLRDYTGVTDIEVLGCGEGRNLVYVTSFRNTTFVDLNNQSQPVQIARLEALDFTGKVQWALFGDSAETIGQNVADTRLLRVTLGRDGYLYTAGESAGTATIFRWRGQPMTRDEQYGQAKPFLTQIDVYSQLHNSGSAHVPYYARVHPTSGQLITSQMSFPRLSNTKANSMRVGDIASGASGRLYFGGAARASIANRNGLTLNAQPVGGYGGSDRTWMSVAPNFLARNFWTVLAKDTGMGIVSGVDAGYGYSAALSNVESGTVPVTTGPATGIVFLSFTTE